MSGRATIQADVPDAAVLAGDYTARRYVPPPRAHALVRAGVEAAAATITVTYTGFGDAARTAFQAAVDVWAALLNSAVTIRIEANWTPLAARVLGSARPTTFVKNGGGAMPPDFYFPSALADRLAGRDLNTGASDIVARFNSSRTDWYLGTDGQVPANQYDLMTVVLHEIGHGLGFSRSFTVDESDPAHRTAKWGFASDPATLVWTDLFVSLGDGTRVTYLVRDVANNSEAMYAALTSGNLFQRSIAGEAANGGRPPKLYAPSPWQAGSSASHLDEATFPTGTRDGLMTPQLGRQEAIHDPGPIALGILNTYQWLRLRLDPDLDATLGAAAAGPAAAGPAHHGGGHDHPETFDEVIARGFPHDRLDELQKAHEARARLAPAVPAPARVRAAAVVTRRNAATLPPAHQVAFRNAVSRLVEDGTYRRLIGHHMDMSHNMHGSMGTVGLYRFLGWHRRYLVEFERELQRADAALRPGATDPLAVPYWRWQDVFPAWLAGFLPARDPRTGAVPPPRRATPPPFATAADLDLIVNQSAIQNPGLPGQNDYTKFTWGLEGWGRRPDRTPLPAHNHGHAWVGGIMNNTSTSPTDPVFWLHHAEVDRLWQAWRQAHPAPGPVLSGTDRVMDPWAESYDDLLDPAALGYAYDTLAL